MNSPVLRYLDVVALIVAAPIALALGAPAVGYGLGLATWLLMRAFGVAVDQRAGAISDVAQQVALRLAYRFLRVALLVAVSVATFKLQGRAAGAAALLVITLAFTVQLSLSIVHRQPLSH